MHETWILFAKLTGALSIENQPNDVPDAIAVIERLMVLVLVYDKTSDLTSIDETRKLQTHKWIYHQPLLPLNYMCLEQ